MKRKARERHGTSEKYRKTAARNSIENMTRIGLDDSAMETFTSISKMQFTVLNQCLCSLHGSGHGLSALSCIGQVQSK